MQWFIDFETQLTIFWREYGMVIMVAVVLVLAIVSIGIAWNEYKGNISKRRNRDGDK